MATIEQFLEFLAGKPKATGPQVPANMTGGVDLTGTVDVDVHEPDALIGLNRAPEVIQTMTGGHGPLAGSVSMPADPTDVPWHENKELTDAFAEVRTDSDGRPVRVIPASRAEYFEYLIAAGNQPRHVASRDPRRLSLGISVFDPLGGVNYIRIGNSRSQAPTGLRLGTSGLLPSTIVLTNTDHVYIYPEAANAASVYVSLVFEIQE